MSQCLVDRYALTLYDPEEHRETVHFYRKRQGAPDEEQAERVTHQRLAELLCMQGDTYEYALDRFDRLCGGARLPLMNLYEYWLDPDDAEVVARNNAAALAEWDALVAHAKTKREYAADMYSEHNRGGSWKRIALSVRRLTTSEKVAELYDRDAVTKAHILAQAEAYEKSKLPLLAAA